MTDRSGRPFVNPSTLRMVRVWTPKDAGVDLHDVALAVTERSKKTQRRLGWTIAIFLGLLPLLGSMAVVPVVATVLGRPLSIVERLGATVGLLLVAAPVLFLIVRFAVRRVVWHVLRTRGVALCEKCGYDLRPTLAAERCPECGTPVASMVALGPRSGAGG